MRFNNSKLLFRAIIVASIIVFMEYPLKSGKGSFCEWQYLRKFMIKRIIHGLGIFSHDTHIKHTRKNDGVFQREVKNDSFKIDYTIGDEGKVKSGKAVSFLSWHVRLGQKDGPSWPDYIQRVACVDQMVNK